MRYFKYIIRYSLSKQNDSIYKTITKDMILICLAGYAVLN